MSRNSRWLALLAVFAVLAAGSVQALPVAPGLSLASPPVTGWVEEAWKWVAAWFKRPEPKPASRPHSASQEKEGCGMDPMGRQLDCK